MENNGTRNATESFDVQELHAQEETRLRGILTIFLDISSEEGIKARATAQRLAEQLGLGSYDDIPGRSCNPSEVEHTVHLLHMIAAKNDAHLSLVTAAPQGELLHLITVYFK